MDNRTITALAKALPCLQFFRCTSRDPSPSPKATIDVLSVIVEHCRELETLVMAFDATCPLPLDDALFAKHTGDSRLRQLQIQGNSAIDDADAVAEFLSIVLAENAHVFAEESAGGEADKTRRERWEKVRTLLEPFGRIRRRERKFWCSQLRQSSKLPRALHSY